MNKIQVDPAKITLTIDDPNDWIIADKLAGSVKCAGMGVFEYKTGALNLQKIFATFTGDKKPQVVGPTWVIDREREALIKYNRYCSETEQICAMERVPVEPNGLFVPFSHQTLIIGVIDRNPYVGVMADCGTGKTGSEARAVEIHLERGDVKRGKVLISAPLSILETSWLDDIKKFTHLKPGLLWLDLANKDILGELEKVFEYGPKPLDAVAVKTKSKTMHRNDLTGQVVAKVTTLEKASPGKWIRFKTKVKVAVNSIGEETPFGPVFGNTAVKEETKRNELRAKLADPQYDLYLINHDGVKIYEEELEAHGFEWVIVDESTKIKNHLSQTYKSHVAISWKSKRRNCLSGTPNPNGFLDLWAQYFFLDRGLTLGASMKDYQAEYFRPIHVGAAGTKWFIQSNEAKERIIRRVRRASIFLKQRDCLDLPPRQDMIRVVRMTGEQERAYLEMEEELITEFEDMRSKGIVRVEAVNTLVKLMKLRQITSGFVVGENATKAEFKDNPKMADLDDFVDSLGDQKLVIACQFKQEIDAVLNRYVDRGIASIEGSVLVRKRNESIRSFQTSDELQMMVLQPQAAAHGITLTEASNLLFYSLDFNFEYYYQTAKRVERISQRNNIFVIHLLATLSDGSPTIDHDLLDVLKGKENDRNALFDHQVDQAAVASELVDRLVKRRETRL